GFAPMPGLAPAHLLMQGAEALGKLVVKFRLAAEPVLITVFGKPEVDDVLRTLHGFPPKRMAALSPPLDCLSRSGLQLQPNAIAGGVAGFEMIADGLDWR